MCEVKSATNKGSETDHKRQCKQRDACKDSTVGSEICADEFNDEIGEDHKACYECHNAVADDIARCLVGKKWLFLLLVNVSGCGFWVLRHVTTKTI